MKDFEMYHNYTVECCDEAVVVEPNLTEVVLHNDDFTPMSFVMQVLETVFELDITKAKEIMWKAHQEGKAVVGWFTQDDAATKIKDVSHWAKKEEHPLLCSMETAS